MKKYGSGHIVDTPWLIS